MRAPEAEPSSEQRCPHPAPRVPPLVLMGPFSAWPEEMVPGPLSALHLPPIIWDHQGGGRWGGAPDRHCFSTAPSVDTRHPPTCHSSFLAHGSRSWEKGGSPSRFELEEGTGPGDGSKRSRAGRGVPVHPPSSSPVSLREPPSPGLRPDSQALLTLDPTLPANTLDVASVTDGTSVTDG